MRVSSERLLIERLFSEYGESLTRMTVGEAYEELKKLSGEDFGIDNEPAWRAWLEEYEG